MQQLSLGDFRLEFSNQSPYHLHSFSNIFSPESYAHLAKGFDLLPWKKKQTKFYSQYEHVLSSKEETPFKLFYTKGFFYPFKNQLEKQLGVPLRDDIRMVAHRLMTSDAIDVHNDYCDPELGYENYRFIFQFSNPNHLQSGGEITFLRSSDRKSCILSAPYSFNFGICFEITPHSFHYVAPVHGQRDTIVMYLWKKESPYDGSGEQVI